MTAPDWWIPDGYAEGPAGLLIPAALVEPEPAFIGVDLFAGCGGFSLGMEWGGLDVAVAVDLVPEAAATYMFNMGMPDGGRIIPRGAAGVAAWERMCKNLRRRKRSPREGKEPRPDEPSYVGFNRARLQRGSYDPEANEYVNELNRGGKLTGPGCRAYLLADICELTGAEILAAGGIAEAHVVFGGPPCQGFSTSGKQNPADPRNNLVLEFLRVAIEIQPAVFLMENVPPLVTQQKFRPLWDEFKRRAREAGYHLVANVLDACNYGVPQRRQRVFARGTRRDVVSKPFQFPIPTTWSLGSNLDGTE